MKVIDLLRIAFRNLKGRWMVLPAAGMAISAFCLCFAGAIFTSVQQAKSLPCELVVTAQNNGAISNNKIAKLSDIPGVTAATPLLQIPVTIKSGSYTATLTLTGLEASYLDTTFLQGSAFPVSSAMPYIVLNDAARRQFTDGKNDAVADVPGTEAALPNIDWLNAAFTVQTGEGAHAIVSKVCGILAGDTGQEPAAYISLTSAKELLNTAGQSTAIMSAHVRVKNIGYAHSVSTDIAALGLTVVDSNSELEAKWDGEMNEVSHLLVIGVFSLLCVLALMTAWRKIILLEQRDAWSMLLWLGLRRRDIGIAFAMQAGIISLIGAAIGITVSLSLPSFLPQELKTTSPFMLPVPAWIAASSGVGCIVTGLLSLFSTKSEYY